MTAKPPRKTAPKAPRRSTPRIPPATIALAKSVLSLARKQDAQKNANRPR